MDTFQNIKVISEKPLTTKTQKPFKALEVEDEAGATFKVNIFSDFPEFALIHAGSLVRGKIEPNGQYTNLVSETQGKGKFGASGGYKTAQIKETMDIKRQDIQKSQENKENSIKIASTIRMAVDIATSLTPEQWQSTTMQEEVRFWREWLWQEWSNIDEKNFPPF